MTYQTIQFSASDDDPRITDYERERLDVDGYIVLPGLLTQHTCDQWSEAVDAIWLQDQARPKNYVVEPGVQFTPNLLRYSLLFERCIIEPKVLDAVRQVLGPSIIFSLVNGRRADSGFGNQPLHDLKRIRGRPFRWCSTIWCLDEFTPSNATRVLPGSHMPIDSLLGDIEDPLAPHPAERRIIAPRGSVIVFNAHLIHAGSTNLNSTPRRCVQCQFAVPSEKPNYDWRTLPEPIKQKLKSESQNLLGLSSTQIRWR